jgi:hypothetical protein
VPITFELIDIVGGARVDTADHFFGPEN